jgi:hypothetical protein
MAHVWRNYLPDFRIVAENLTKDYEDVTAVNNVSFRVEPQLLQSILIPSLKPIKNAIYTAYLSPFGSVTQEVASSSLVSHTNSGGYFFCDDK